METVFENNSDTLNFTFSFGPFRCGIPPFLPPTVPEAISTIQATIVLITILMGLALNGFVVFLVARFKVLQQRAFFMALQLVVINLVFTTIVLFPEFITAVTGEWMFGDDMCQVSGFLHDGFASMRFLLTLAFTLDRFFTVFLPFYYAKHGGKVSALMSIAVWIVSLFRVSIPLRGGLDCYAYVPTFKTCTAVTCTETCKVYILTIVGMTAFLGDIVPFALYIVLFIKAKKIKNKTQPALSTDTQSSTAARHNSRAMITFLILFLALIGCTTPPVLLYMISFALPADQGPNPVLLIFQIIVGRSFFNALTVIDPIVLMRNRDVREVLTKMKQQWCARLGASELSNVG